MQRSDGFGIWKYPRMNFTDDISKCQRTERSIIDHLRANIM